MPRKSDLQGIHYVEEFEMSISDFLRSRGHPESLIKNLEDEKIDCASIMLMPDEDLKVFFPKYGDRLSIKDFCKKSTCSKKTSLIEKLKEKLNKKGNNKENDFPERPRKSLKNTRVIEIGWLCTSKEDDVFRQVKTKAGGGTRKVNIPKILPCIEVLEKAETLFFPNGVSTKGHLDDFEVKLLDYKSHECNLDLTIQKMYELSALTVLRFYMGTIYKKKPNHDNEETYIPQTITGPPSSSENNVEPLPGSSTEHLRRSERLNQIPLTRYFQEFEEEVYQQSEFNFELAELFGLENQEERTLIVRRGNIFDDLLKAFEQDFFTNVNFKLELILPTGERELAEDFGGVWRDVLSEFWYTFYEKCTVGTTMKVPYIRHDFGELQWKAIATIFFKGFIMEKYIPIKIAPVFIKTCFNLNITDEDLIGDFFNYVCDTDRKIFEQAQKHFDEVDVDELVEIFSTYECKWNPNKENFKQLLRDIAHKELIQKPSFVVKCFQKQWQGKITNSEEILDQYEKCKPSVKNCLRKIELQDENITREQSIVFNYLKKFIKEADDNIREAFFRFCTGSNLPIMTIKVAFTDTDTTGINRLPIAHTCSGLLQLPSIYEDFVTLRSEFNSILSSNIWIMDIV